MSNLRTTPPVVFYRYEASPISAKVQNALAFKNIAHYRVETAMQLPRPEITDALGIGYRRIPILSIGNDIYCDSSLIVPALEQHFPPEKGYYTIYPKRKGGGGSDTGMIRALATYYMDRPLFGLVSASLPWDKFQKDFVEDRSKWFGASMDIKKMMERQPSVQSQLSSHLNMLQEQLADGREWLFDTVEPGLGDLAAYTVYSWAMRFSAIREVFSKEKFPMASEWMERMAAFVKAKREANEPAITKIDGVEAAKIIADNQDAPGPSISFDADEARRLQLKQGQEVEVVPDDNARDYPTTGTLIGLTREEVVLQMRGSAVPSLRCHFPRFNFTVRSTTKIKL